jgi:type IV fimbrial biogenesis protein FimT
MRSNQSGFNLLELMVTLLIAGLVLGFGMPSLAAFMSNNRMAGVANDLVTSIHVARTEAVKRRGIATMCASSNWADDNPDCDLGGDARGWIVFADVDGDVSVDAGDTIVLTHAPPANVNVFVDAASRPYLQFGGNGFPRTAAAGLPITNFVLCDDRGDASTGEDTNGDEIAAGRWIAIGITGRPQLYRLRNDVQASPVGGCGG